MSNVERLDLITNFNFVVEIDGISRASFHECSGINSAVDVIEHNEGGSTSPMKLTGQTKYANITLRRGITEDRDLYDWHLTAVNGAVQRKNGSIIIRNALGDEKARWNFFNVWPVRWAGPALNAEGTDVAIEEFELAVERVERG